MKWRRGILLAGIHLAICVPLVIWEDARVWEYLHALTLPESMALRLATFQEEQTGFSPCSLWESISLQRRIITLAEIPAAMISGWREACPARWTLAGMVGAGWPHDTRAKEAKASVGLSAPIALQWLILGGFPMVRPRRWWQEPGALITLCISIGAPLLAIGELLVGFHIANAELTLEPLGLLASIPMLVAACMRIVWFGLFLWTMSRFCFRCAFCRRPLHSGPQIPVP